jgi:phosphonate metabolism-associated iron-containing alcohol dehydrogenase
MKRQWRIWNPCEIYFGRGSRKILSDELGGRSCLVVSSARGRDQMIRDPNLSSFVNTPSVEWLDTVKPTPDVKDLQTAINAFKGCSFDAIVGFGGGSAMDSAKVLAVALSSEAKDIELSTLLKKPVLHDNLKPVPLYALPTTAGTGSEVTPFATVWDHSRKKKHSMAGSAVYPKVAVIDPALTDNLPQDPTLFTGLDAINQAVESIWNNNATSVSILYATRAIKLGLNSLPKLIKGEGNAIARDNMAESSLLAGLAISQTKTALCHSISYTLTSHFDIPHGLACAFTMPAVLKLNMTADDGRIKELERELNTDDILHLFLEFNKNMRVKDYIKKYVKNCDQMLRLVSHMIHPERAGNNLAPVDGGKIEEIIELSWGYQ